MAVKDYQLSDYDNNIARKILQNQADVIRGDLSLSVTGGVVSAGEPRDYSPEDEDNVILQKILQNQADVIRGNLSYTTT